MFISPLHISSNVVLIIGRLNCTNTASGIVTLYMAVGCTIYNRAIVCQVGHLLKLYQDARSAKHKKKKCLVL